MPYIRGGEVVDRRSLWRLSIIVDIFWAIVNFIGFFFISMISPEQGGVKKNKGRGGGGRPGGWGPGGGGGGGGPPGGGGRGLGRGGGLGGMSNVRGVDHSAPCGPSS